MYVVLSSQCEFWDETLATPGRGEGGGAPFGRGPAAEEFEAQPNALVLCVIYTIGTFFFFCCGRFFNMFYTNVCIPLPQ